MVHEWERRIDLPDPAAGKSAAEIGPTLTWSGLVWSGGADRRLLANRDTRKF
jgi:hypothetical protein